MVQQIANIFDTVIWSFSNPVYNIINLAIIHYKVIAVFVVELYLTFETIFNRTAWTLFNIFNLILLCLHYGLIFIEGPTGNQVALSELRHNLAVVSAITMDEINFLIEQLGYFMRLLLTAAFIICLTIGTVLWTTIVNVLDVLSPGCQSSVEPFFGDPAKICIGFVAVCFICRFRFHCMKCFRWTCDVLHRLIVGPTELVAVPVLQIERHGDALLCVVCQERVKCVVLLPCRHLCLCEPCVQALHRLGQHYCPMCRNFVQSQVVVFT